MPAIEFVLVHSTESPNKACAPKVLLSIIFDETIQRSYFLFGAYQDIYLNGTWKSMEGASKSSIFRVSLPSIFTTLALRVWGVKWDAAERRQEVGTENG